ncbi:TSUP family transporter [Streptomyces mirabilis]|nr:TSUP family transporter [Streptomyces mirabilis]
MQRDHKQWFIGNSLDTFCQMGPWAVSADESTSRICSCRRELRGQARRLAHLATGSALGGPAGALLLLRLPARTFQAAVPVLILTACALTLAQPYLRRRLDRRTRTTGHGPPGLWTAAVAQRRQSLLRMPGRNATGPMTPSSIRGNMPGSGVRDGSPRTGLEPSRPPVR